MKKFKILIVLPVLGIFMGCSNVGIGSAPRDSDALLPSDLVSNPDKFDGKHVNVRGYVIIGPESRNIFDTRDGSLNRNGACLGLSGDNAVFSKFHRGQTRVSGIFRQNICGPNDVCLYWCGQSGIELDEGSVP